VESRRGGKVGLGFEAGRGVSGVCHTVDLVMMRVGKDSEAETAKKSRAETAKTRRLGDADGDGVGKDT
jgi:hypothetical protein